MEELGSSPEFEVPLAQQTDQVYSEAEGLRAKAVEIAAVFMTREAEALAAWGDPQLGTRDVSVAGQSQSAWERARHLSHAAATSQSCADYYFKLAERQERRHKRKVTARRRVGQVLNLGGLVRRPKI